MTTIFERTVNRTVSGIESHLEDMTSFRRHFYVGLLLLILLACGVGLTLERRSAQQGESVRAATSDTVQCVDELTVVTTHFGR